MQSYGLNSIDQVTTLVIGTRVYQHFLSYNPKLMVGHLRTYGATLSVLHSESLTLFVQKGKRQKLGDLGTSCARNGYGALRRMT